ncbi:hypothetical protein JY651_29935 [Pyxidicoccus parkwayensis]|uniref:Uncharacterized protein n=1 Tax=Pyxidicoccus parkwayensis TaxID=2813578 RepID=A0ABX7NKZ6_9BACT|nr:hypothetical protein [Pyxidicoccus parkwaysis]QSQ19526.1 hypothetical protein JY651_29935 [Pyxidicoccus parkwaysis]
MSAVFFTDGVAVDADTLVVSAGLTDAPASRLYVKLAGTWLRHDVVDDFLISVAHHHGLVCALGRQGHVSWAGEWERPLTPWRIRGRFREYVITEAEARGPLERVRAVDGAFFACGRGGQFYRVQSGSWLRLERGLDPWRENAFLDLDGFARDDLYVVGMDGVAAHFDGSRWRYLHPPTRAHLYAVRCLSRGEVVVAGAEGTLYRGGRHGWRALQRGTTAESFWSICAYGQKLYLTSGLHGLHTYARGTFSDVTPGMHRPLTHRLDAAGDVLWSVGPRSLLRFDGTTWSEPAGPDAK